MIENEKIRKEKDAQAKESKERVKDLNLELKRR